MQQRYYRASRANTASYQAGDGERVAPTPSEFESPALLLGKRIKKEQGRERAYEFLSAMEPFLAPGERELIASQLGVAMPEPGSYSRAYKDKEPSRTPPGGSAAAGPDNMAGFLKLMQLMNGMQGAPGGAQKTPGTGGMPDPAMLAKLMGMLK